MSNLINELLGKVSSLTQTVNQILSGSKSIPELPAQNTLDVSSLLHASRDGISEKISVQQIVNAVINNDNDQLLSVGAISLSSNNLTIASISGKINNVVQSIPTPTIVNIPYCASGLSRVDLIVYNNTNTIVRIAGTETAGAIIVTPTLPLDTLLVTQISVSDSAIGDPTSPILGASYVKKSFANMFEFNGTGANAIIPLHPSGYSEIRLINAGLTSISGVDLSLMSGANFELPYVGKPFIFWNRTGENITLTHEDFANATYPLFLTQLSDVIFPNNHFVIFKWDAGGLYQVDKNFFSIAEIIGLTTALSAKLDKVSTVDVDKVYVKNANGTQGMKPVSELGGGGGGDEFLLYKKRWKAVSLNTNTWKNPGPHNGFDNDGFGTYGTATTPTDLTLYGTWETVPTGYIIDSVEFEILFKSSAFTPCDIQVFLETGEVNTSSSTAGVSSITTLVNQTVSVPSGSNLMKFIVPLTVASNSLPTLNKKLIFTSIRDLTLNSIVYMVGFNFKFKKV